MPESRLSQLQTDLLEAFFHREKRFFLTGGAALAGFYLGHRTTNDLDLFVTSDILDAGDLTLQEATTEIGGTDTDHTAFSMPPGTTGSGRRCG